MRWQNTRKTPEFCKGFQLCLAVCFSSPFLSLSVLNRKSGVVHAEARPPAASHHHHTVELQIPGLDVNTLSEHILCFFSQLYPATSF